MLAPVLERVVAVVLAKSQGNRKGKGKREAITATQRNCNMLYPSFHVNANNNKMQQPLIVSAYEEVFNEYNISMCWLTTK